MLNRKIWICAEPGIPHRGCDLELLEGKENDDRELRAGFIREIGPEGNRWHPFAVMSSEARPARTPHFKVICAFILPF